MNEVADDVEGRPGVGTFVRSSPGIGKAAEHGIESGGCAGEDGDRVGKIEIHELSFYDVNSKFRD
jgi:hypothetical protein